MTRPDTDQGLPRSAAASSMEPDSTSRRISEEETGDPFTSTGGTTAQAIPASAAIRERSSAPEEAPRPKVKLYPQTTPAGTGETTKNVEITKEQAEENKVKREKNVKESTDYYNKNTEKPGSLASKAAMVKQFNEKNNKN